MADPRKRARYDALRDEGLDHQTAVDRVEGEFADFSDVGGGSSSTAVATRPAVTERTSGDWRPGDPEEMEGGTAFTNAVIRPAVQGASLGFSDEIRGLGAAVVPGGDDYTTARDKERAALATAKAEHPVISRAAEFTGAVAAPVGLFGKATQGANYGRRILEGVKLGGKAGTLAGAGYSEGQTPGEVAVDAAAGGLLGGTLGGAVPAITGAPGAVRSGIAKLRELAGAHPEMADDVLGMVSPRTAAAKRAFDRLRGMGKEVGDELGPELGEEVADELLDAPPPRPRIGMEPEAYALAKEAIKNKGRPGPKVPTPRTRTWPSPTTATPTAPAPAPAGPTLSQQVGQWLQQVSDAPPPMASAAETARRITAATSGRPRVGGLVSQPPIAPAAPPPATSPIVPSPNRGWGPGLSGRGYAGADDAQRAIHRMYAETGGPEDFSELLRQSIAIAMQRKAGR